jgi:hypothetical protein
VSAFTDFLQTFDDRHVVLQGKTSVHLFRTEDIIEIEYEQQAEIVAP